MSEVRSAREEMERALSALRLEAPAAVCDDVTEKCRAAVTEAMLAMTHVAIMEFEPRPGVRLKVTVPNGTPPETIKQIMATATQYFPGHPIFAVTQGIQIEEDQ